MTVVNLELMNALLSRAETDLTNALRANASEWTRQTDRHIEGARQSLKGVVEHLIAAATNISPKKTRKYELHHYKWGLSHDGTNAGEWLSKLHAEGWHHESSQWVGETLVVLSWKEQ